MDGYVYLDGHLKVLLSFMKQFPGSIVITYMFLDPYRFPSAFTEVISFDLKNSPEE